MIIRQFDSHAARWLCALTEYHPRLYVSVDSRQLLATPARTEHGAHYWILADTQSFAQGETLEDAIARWREKVAQKETV